MEDGLIVFGDVIGGGEDEVLVVLFVEFGVFDGFLVGYLVVVDDDCVCIEDMCGGGIDVVDGEVVVDVGVVFGLIVYEVGGVVVILEWVGVDEVFVVFDE